MNDNLLERLNALIFSDLIASSPVMSGNMQSLIQLAQVGIDEITIVIDAPFYDTKEWAKSKVVKYTGESYGGVQGYANWVNEKGAFGKHNQSEGWVNRVIYECCSGFANEIGGILINELQL